MTIDLGAMRYAIEEINREKRGEIRETYALDDILKPIAEVQVPNSKFYVTNVKIYSGVEKNGW